MSAAWAFDNGEAWFAGSCIMVQRSIRFGYLGGKFVTMEPPIVTQQLAGFGSHPAQSSFFASGLWARSPREIYLAGRHDSGNLMWYRPLERFDGQAWRSVPSRMADPEEVELQSIAGTPRGVLWGMSRSKGEGGRFYRLEQGQWVQKRGGVLVYEDLAFDPAGTLWAVGYGGNVLRFDGKGWHELERLQDEGLRRVVIAADGAVYALGNHLWRLDGARPRRLELRGVRGLWAAGAGKLWLTTGGDHVIRTDDERPVERYALLPAKDCVAPIVGSDAAIWVACGQWGAQIYRLDLTASPP